ncbi:C4-dicarboxylate ABC transporter permease [Alginatibacterium sediminis]|uniref:C4-dicarboxylate ABC transporter permease n=1 Tax=Alginatibacterium sediminis TaxID=2164068 RepID=A0A420EGR9_9ALTE|nr:tripartite tricarboxylate transporter permease [Alginatibacterium sediminis]RKF19873.1 C4-dicarboxylate ABC transporter permease [Alginatibacterium sediminis]
MLVEALNLVLQPSVLLFIILGVAGGMCIGCLPGLTTTMGVALVLPLTFGMDATQSILLLIGVYVGAVYGGSMSAILLNTPGTPASAATALDGYQMAKRGEAGRALGIATTSSFLGGVISCIFLILISPVLAKFALKFSAPEFFMLAMFGLCIISSISGKSMLIGLLSGTFGILIATIGIDDITGSMRFTFNNMNLFSGISFIPVMIGLFAMSQAFVGIEDIFVKSQTTKKLSHVFPKREDWGLIVKNSIGFGSLGAFVGSIPGVGADIASFIAYGQAKSMSKHPEKFGTGLPEAISAPEAANNGVTGGALIPMLTLGVPGDAVAAIMIGALTVQGLQPGPLLFQNDAPVVYAIFIGLLLANICMLVLGLNSVRLFTKVLSVPKQILVPIIFLLCFVGSYALANNVFDVIVMLVFGVIGYFFHKLEVSASPAILGLILGPMAESNFRRALLMARGDYLTFLSTGICWTFFVLILVSLLWPFAQKQWLKRKHA